MRLASSFRDPHGFVFRRDGVLYRQVNEPHAEHHARFLESGLYGALVDEGLLVPHDDASIELAVEPGAIAVLRPNEVSFVSYPYEWGFLQLRDAALLTLRIQELALDHGMSLRDASAYNVTFDGFRPVFIDTTSFEIVREGRPWVAYRQFCEQFLAPLALMAFRDVRLGQLSRVWLEGVPVDLASELLPARASTRPGLAMHLRLHARAQRRPRKDSGEERAGGMGKGFSPQAFRGLIASLRKSVEGLVEPAGVSIWRDYYRDADHYTDEAADEKEAVVRRSLDDLGPSSVWDLGANTGRFARIASAASIDTLAFDLDPFCVDEGYRQACETQDRHLVPLVMDLANPSPGTGWANQERATLFARGTADLVLALALVHHLAIGHNVPLAWFVDLLARAGRRAVVEWVPRDDEKVQRLLRTRDDVFPDYTADVFEAAIARRFTVAQRQPLSGTGRILYLVEQR